MNSDSGLTAWFLLWGLKNRRLDCGLSILTLAVILTSRFALLASGPWEWDETIFARGMLDFDLASHFPHPPGFPGLLALGHLFLPLAGTPYEALQWVSALAGAFIVWPLAAIGRRVASSPVAAAAAVLVVFLIGPWLYSVRGFSTTAAMFFAITAAAVWAGGLHDRRATWFSVLVAIAWLVRPILMPTLALLWLGGISTIRPRRKILPGFLIGACLVLGAVAAMVFIEGSWSAFATPFVTHATSHANRLYLNTRNIHDLGLVKGVGGMIPALVMAVTSSIGIAAWARKTGWKSALVWVVLLTVTITQLVMLQNRSYARYAVAVHLSAAPLLAGAASLLPAPIAVASLLGGAGWAAASSYPLLHEQHVDMFSAWEVTLEAAETAHRKDWAVVVEPEVHVFSSYWWHVLEWQGRTAPAMVLSPRAPEAWSGIDRPWLVATVHPHLYLPSLNGEQTSFGAVSERLKPMTQGRFLTAELIHNPPLPVGEWWTLEHMEDGTPFMWAGPDAQLWIPPMPAGSLVAIRHRPMPGDEPLLISVESQAVRKRIDGHSAPAWTWLPATPDQPTIVSFERSCGYSPGNGDDRALALQVLGLKVRLAGEPVIVSRLDDAEFERLGIKISGRYPLESFARAGRGFWLQPEAHISMPISEPGRLLLRLSAPRPTPPETTVAVDSRVEQVDIRPGAGGQEVSIDVAPTDIYDNRIEVVIRSEAFVPSSMGRGADHRRLGVALHGIRFVPAGVTSSGWWSPSLEITEGP